jgi:hypothetical protein
MYALAEIWIKCSARLEARFLVRREPISGPEADWRPALVLVVPVSCGLAGMVVELRRALTILIRTAISALRPTIGLSGVYLNRCRCRHQGHHTGYCTQS